MTVNFIDSTISSSRSNMGRSVCNYGSKETFSKQYVSPSGTNYLFNQTAENLISEPSRPPFGLGTGVLVNSTGVLLFDAASGVGALTEATIANRGSNTAYIVVNSTGVTVRNGLELIANESVELEGPVYKIGAVTASGTALIVGDGIPNININAI